MPMNTRVANEQGLAPKIMVCKHIKEDWLQKQKNTEIGCKSDNKERGGARSWQQRGRETHVVAMEARVAIKSKLRWEAKLRLQWQTFNSGGEKFGRVCARERQGYKKKGESTWDRGSEQ